MSQETIREEQPRSKRPAQLRLGALVAVALAVAFLVWLIASGGDDDDGENRATDATATAGEITARAATQAELVELAESLDYPLYWAGPLPDRTYELTRTRSGRVYIRYLPGGVRVGDRRPQYLTVGTYPQADGFAAVRAASRRPNTVSREAAGGALIVFDRRRPQSAYFSFADARFQVEVFHPMPRRARELTLAGDILRVR